MRRLLLLLLIVAFFGPVALAAARTWKSSNGRFSTEAELLGVKDGKVQLKKSDGKVVEVPLKSLSAADRQFVIERYPEAAGSGEAEKKKKAAEASPPDDEKEADPEDEPEAATDAVENIELKPLRLEPPKRKSRGRSVSLGDYILSLTQPQEIVQQDKGDGPSGAEFRQLVKKEPKYAYPIPFRGVVKLGGRSFCLALDAVSPKADGYDRLYFDANGNGDLTDDPTASATETARSGNMSQSQFPRVNVALDAGGEKLDYAFLVGALCNQDNGKLSIAVSLYSAMAREGFIVKGKKRTKVLLVDRNSNGRYDDAVSLQPNGTLAEGDLLMINPNPKKGLAAGGMGPDRNLVGKLVAIGKSFHRMTVGPSGGKLQLSPVELSLGNVVCANYAFRAVLTSDEYGVVLIGGAKDQKIALAEGTWKVVNYTLGATVAGGNNRTVVEAAYRNNPPSVIVKKGETAALPFGVAFRAVVTATRTEQNKVSLSLEIVGPSGEHCSNILINGSRPPKPRFVIKDKSGKIAHQGEFEYG